LQEVVDDNLDWPRLPNIAKGFAKHCDKCQGQGFPVRANGPVIFNLPG